MELLIECKKSTLISLYVNVTGHRIFKLILIDKKKNKMNKILNRIKVWCSFLSEGVLSESYPKAVTTAFILISLIHIPMLIWIFHHSADLVMDQNEIGLAYAKAGYATAILNSVLLAPIIESILLGGCLLGLRKVKVPDLISIIFTALLFSLIHKYYPIAKFPQFVIYSYIFLYSLKFTSKLGAWSRISAIHALNNLTFAVILPNVMFSFIES